MQLSPRLKSIAHSIDHCNTVADIGSDHAYLPIYLIENQRSEKAIASDINQGPFDISKKRIHAYKMESKIEIRKGNGLDVLKPQEAETIVIAGMGGLLIVEILEAGLEVAKNSNRLILQPMTEANELRKWLYSHSFEIVDEELVEDENIIYEIIWTAFSGQGLQIQQEYLHVGKKIIEKKHPLALRFINERIKELDKVMAILKEKDTKGCRGKLVECIQLLAYYEEVRKWV